MKKILLILAAVVIPYLHCLAADNVTINGLNYLLDSSDRSAIVSTQSTSLSGAITIPSSVTYSGTTYSVTGLASKAFQNCSNLTAITIPNSVENLGEYCFDGCRNLTSAAINANITSLPTSCFESCSNLTSISIPNTVNGLGSYCFSRCSKLSSITLPSGLKTLGLSCFYDCKSLKEITLPYSVTSIDMACFSNCSSLSKFTCNSTMPPSVSSSAFDGTLCQYGTLLVPSAAVSAYQATTTWKNWKNIKQIGSSVGTFTSATINGLNYLLDPNDHIAIVYTQSTSLSGAITIPSSVSYSGTSYSVKAITSNAFSNCSLITSVTISNSVTSLLPSCFSLCSGLTSIIIPSSVSFIGNHCFYLCRSLTSATINANVTSLPLGCFSGCIKLTSISIPSTVTTIEDSCFSDCSKLSSITLPNGLKTLGSFCFSRCSALTEITLPSSITSVGQGGFSNCSTLAKLTCNATTPPFVNSTAFEGTLYQSGTLLVPSSAVSAYQAATTWKDWKTIQAAVVAENKVYLSDATTAQNTTKAISVKLKNDSQITNFQFDVYLPTGVTMATSGGNYVYAKGSRLASSHSITCAQQSDGAYRFFCYSASNALFTGNDGEIMNFTVQVPNATATGEYTITIKNAKVAETNGTKYTTENTSAKLTVTQGTVSVTGITLNSTSASLTVGDTKALTATVTPTNATNKNVTWSSSNTSVATVSSSGVVTAKAAGTATITCTAADGSGKSAICSITVAYKVGDVNKDGKVDNADVTIISDYILGRTIYNASSCDVNGDGEVTIADLAIVVDLAKNNVTHEYVDLGLSVKWATCNVGASKPEDYGDYYAWGEVETKSTYDWSTYKWCNGSSTTMTKYCTSSTYGTVDNKTILDIEDDVAHVKWGGSWRMPTKAEIDELRNTNNCTWTWTTQNGVEGYQVTSKKNGKTIFLPAAGFRSGSSLDGAGSYGNYWSSSLSEYGSNDAYVLSFVSSRVSMYDYFRDYGRSVRPVCP